MTFVGSPFAVGANLHVHKRIHSGDKPHECSVCKKRFTWPGDLAKHNQIHVKDIEQDSMQTKNFVKQFECKICEKKFSKESSLRRHETRIHMGLQL